MNDILKIEKLRVEYRSKEVGQGTKVALQGLNLSVGQGEVFGFLGGVSDRRLSGNGLVAMTCRFLCRINADIIYLPVNAAKTNRPAPARSQSDAGPSLAL